jgi:hypothetical protein
MICRMPMQRFHLDEVSVKLESVYSPINTMHPEHKVPLSVLKPPVSSGIDNRAPIVHNNVCDIALDFGGKDTLLKYRFVT